MSSMMKKQVNRIMSACFKASLILILEFSAGLICYGLVTYPNRTTVASGVNNIYSIETAETSVSDGYHSILAGGQSTLLSLRGQPLSPIETEYRSAFTRASDVRGVEASAFLQQRNQAVSIVVACSHDGLSGTNIPDGAIQLIRDRAPGSDAEIFNLIPSHNFQGPTILMTEVNGRGVKIIDIDNDGDKDIIATISGMSSTNDLVGFLLLLQNDGNNNFSTKILSENLKGIAVFDIGDCDQNGESDIAVLGIDSKELTVYYQEQNHTFTGVMIDSNVAANLAISVGNFNDDRGADIFTIGETEITGYLATVNVGPFANFREFTKNDLFKFDATSHLSKNYRYWKIKLYDADHDGLVDILATYGKQTGLKWMRQQAGLQVRGPVNLIPDVFEPLSFCVTEKNKNGICDIIIHSGLVESIFLYSGSSIYTDFNHSTSEQKYLKGLWVDFVNNNSSLWEVNAQGRSKVNVYHINYKSLPAYDTVKINKKSNRKNNSFSLRIVNQIHLNTDTLKTSSNGSNLMYKTRNQKVVEKLNAQLRKNDDFRP